MKIIQLFSFMVVFSLAFLSCNRKENPAPRQSEVQPTTQPKAAVVVPPPPPSPAQPAVDFESDPVFQQAKGLSHSDIHKAMSLLETAIAKAPDDPHSAPYYVLIGRLKKEFENCVADYANSSLSEAAKQCSGFTEYAQARPTEYFYNEIAGNYLYSGSHFQELEKKFPSSPLAVEAAYEMTLLSQGGECEGFLDCYIENGFARVHDFLLRYPDSPHTAETIKRADDAFRKTLWGDVWKTEWAEVKDPNKPSDYYDPANLKKLVQEYEDLAEKLPVRSRASCWETVAYYRYKFGEKDHAKALYQRILKENPEYENNNEVRKQLAALQ